MDVLGDMLLARAVLTQYQHAYLDRRNQMYRFLNIPVCFSLPFVILLKIMKSLR